MIDMYMKEPYSKRNPFKVPDGYFSQLEANVMRRIAEEGQAPHISIGETRHSAMRGKKAIKLHWQKKWLPFAGLAASVAIIVTIAYRHLSPVEAQNDSIAIESMISTDCADAQVENVYDYLLLDNETIYDYATED